MIIVKKGGYQKPLLKIRMIIIPKNQINLSPINLTQIKLLQNLDKMSTSKILNMNQNLLNLKNQLQNQLQNYQQK